MDTPEKEKITKALASMRPCMISLILDTIANLDNENAERVLGKLQILRDFYNLSTPEKHT